MSKQTSSMKRTLKELFGFCSRDERLIDKDERRRLPSFNRQQQIVGASFSLQNHYNNRLEPKNFEQTNEISNKQWLASKLSTEQLIVDSFDELEQVAKEEEEKLYNLELSYLKLSVTSPLHQFEDEQYLKCFKMGKSEETKTSSNDNKNLNYESGLLVRYTSQLFSVKVNSDQSKRFANLGKQQKLLLDMFYELQVCDFNLLAKHEALLIQSMVGEDLCKYITKRAKSDTVLVAHDPTGSIVLQQLFMSQKVYYLEEQKTFSQVIDKALRKLNMDSKLERIIKSDIIFKLDTAIINLMNHEFIDVAAIFYEYMHLAHDIILLLPAEMSNSEIVQSVSKALKMTDQSIRHSSIEMQHIYDGDTLAGKILYYGDVSDVDLSEELNFLYSRVTANMKKQYKYKVLIREMRKKHGMLKIFELFDQAGLINEVSDDNFQSLLLKLNNTPFLWCNINQFRNKNVSRNSIDTSSTESENNEITLIDLDKQSKVYSKSVDLGQNKPPTKRLFKSDNYNQRLSDSLRCSKTSYIYGKFPD